MKPGHAAALALVVLCSVASLSTAVPASLKKGVVARATEPASHDEQHAAAPRHMHLGERMRFQEIGTTIKVDAEMEKRRRRHHASAHASAHGKSTTAARAGSEAKLGHGLLAKSRSKYEAKSNYNAKTGSSSSTVKSGSGGGMMAGVGNALGGMAGGAMNAMGMGGGYGGMGMMGGMGGMGMGGMGRAQPVDFPPRGVGMAPMGFGQFVPSGKAIPRQPGVMYYTASGVQECAICKQIIHTAARWGTGFYGLCQMDKEQLDMCHAQQKVLQACPEFTNNWCYQDLGGTQVLRSPCPVHLICHYCLGTNPLHCATREVIDVSMDSLQKT